MAINYLASTTDSYVSATPVRLKSIIVGKKATSAVVTVYNGGASTSGTACVIDAATNNGIFEFDELFPEGLYVGMSGGDANVTVLTA